MRRKGSVTVSALKKVPEVRSTSSFFSSAGGGSACEVKYFAAKNDRTAEIVVPAKACICFIFPRYYKNGPVIMLLTSLMFLSTSR